MGSSSEPYIRNKESLHTGIPCANSIEKISKIQQNNPVNNTKHSDEIDFEKHANAFSMSLSCEEMTKVRSLCTEYEVIFSRNSNDMGFCDKIYHKKRCCAMQSYIRQHEL